MKTFYGLSIITLLLIIPMQIHAQKLSQEDYKRAVSFMYDNYNNKTAFNLDTKVNWFKDNSGIWFVDYSKEGETYKTVSFINNKVEVLFNHIKLANELNKLLEEKVTSNNLSLNNIERTKSGNLIINVKDKRYIYNTKKNMLEISEEEKKEEVKPFESKSPDGKWIAYSKDYNLFIKSTETNEEHQLSFDGKKNYEYASFYGWYDKMEGENGERPKNFSVDWSKDSKWISTNVVDLRNAEKMYLLDWSIDSLYR
ncbi:MAG TPA: DPP IV N-terminal domain-containing protein, partial [Lutibacter sp.]|nr:DPP IV N-terminal domain-containing protein [Lutibacter sp.]